MFPVRGACCKTCLPEFQNALSIARAELEQSHFDHKRRKSPVSTRLSLVIRHLSFVDGRLLGMRQQMAKNQ
jgi:hypothetical protein